jgi:AsmA-like C-terminal region
MSASRAAVLEPTPPGQQPKRVPRWRRWLLISAACFVVLTAIGLTVFFLRFPFSRDRVRQALEETFHGQIAFAHFRVTYFPHPGCVAEGLTMVHPLSPDGSPPLVSVRKFIVQAHYIYLLARPGYISRVTLEGLHIQVPARGSGRPVDQTETPSKTHIGIVVADNALLEVARENGRQPLRYEIHTLTLHDVSRWKPFAYEAALLDALPPGEIQTRGHFGPWNSQDPGATRVSGTYKFERANLAAFPGISGTLSSNDNFHGTLKQIESNGTVDVPDFKVNTAARGVPLHASYHAFVNSLNGDVRLEHVDTLVSKTRLLAHGSVAGRPGHPGKITSLDLNVNEGRIQDLFRVFVKEPRSPFSGVIRFRAHVEVPPRGKPFMTEVVLDGDFGVESGKFTKPKTQEGIATLSQRAQGKQTDEKHKDHEEQADKEKNGGAQKQPAQDTDQDNPERLIIDLAGHLDLKNGIATFTNLSFGIPGALAYAHGTFNLLTDKIDFHGSMKTDSNFTKVAGGGIKSIFLKPFDAIFKKKPKGAEIPVQLTGTYYDPHPGIELGGGKNAVKKENETKGEKQKDQK